MSQAATTPDIPGLVFSEADHIYTYRGRRIPNVTRLLESAGLTTLHLIPDDVREWALERGRRVHAACALYDNGTLDWDSVSSGDRPYVEAWARFSNMVDFIPEAVEERVLGPGPQRLWMNRRADIVPRWAGTLDARGSMRGFPRVLIDRKCGDEVPPAARLQLSGYRLTLDDGEKYVRAVVQLRGNGEPKLHLYDEDDRDAGVFLSVVTVEEFKAAFMPAALAA